MPATRPPKEVSNPTGQPLSAASPGAGPPTAARPRPHSLATLAQGLDQADFNLLLHFAAILTTPLQLSDARAGHDHALGALRPHLDCLNALADQLDPDDLRLLVQFATLLENRPKRTWRDYCEPVAPSQPASHHRGDQTMFCPLCRSPRTTTTTRPGDPDVEHRCSTCGHAWFSKRPPATEELLTKAHAAADATGRHDTRA